MFEKLAAPIWKRNQFNIMKHFAMSLTIVAVAACAMASWAATQDRPIKEVKKEMPASEVQALLGKPDRIGRQILFRRHLEQWIYNDLNARVEFSCAIGEQPRVLNVLQSGSPIEP